MDWLLDRQDHVEIEPARRAGPAQRRCRVRPVQLDWINLSRRSSSRYSRGSGRAPSTAYREVKNAATLAPRARRPLHVIIRRVREHLQLRPSQRPPFRPTLALGHVPGSVALMAGLDRPGADPAAFRVPGTTPPRKPRIRCNNQNIQRNRIRRHVPAPAATAIATARLPGQARVAMIDHTPGRSNLRVGNTGGALPTGTRRSHAAARHADSTVSPHAAPQAARVRANCRMLHPMQLRALQHCSRRRA